MSDENAPKRRIVLLGTGFATVTLLRTLRRDSYQITVVSPRNHFLFTPLLPSTTVGTIEFRSVIEPIRQNRPGIEFFRASAIRLDTQTRQVFCQDTMTRREFAVPYDLLVIGVGAVNNSFGTPGVLEHAAFLKEARDARKIRNRIMDCIEQASLPGTPAEERNRLLHFAVVGGGPTGIEFAAELRDLVDSDLMKTYPRVAPNVQITLFEAGKEILGAFDETLRNYTKAHFKRQHIRIRLESPVAEVREKELVLKGGERVPTGLVVWSTGYGPSEFVKSLPFSKGRFGQVLTDEYLRIPEVEGIYAVGDCAQVSGRSLPQTAQVAMQQGKSLAAAFNAMERGKQPRPFKFVNLGMLAYIGENEALAEIPKAGIFSRGMLTYLLWRSAYLTRLVSVKNKVLVLFDWVKTSVFGRDLSRF